MKEKGRNVVTMHTLVTGIVLYLPSQAKAKTETKALILNKEPRNVTNLSTLWSFKTLQSVVNIDYF